jgi:hypothetical protein
MSKKTKIFEMMEEESSKKVDVTEANLGVLSQMAARQKRFEAPVQTEPDYDERLMKLYTFVKKKELSIPLLEKLLAMVKTDYEKLRTVDIPELMMGQLNLKSIELAEGGKLEIKPGLSCSVTKENMPKFFAYLKKNKAEDLIKHEVTVLFAPEEKNKALTLIKKLTKDKMDFKEKRGVHGSTLKKHIKGLLEKGKKAPKMVYVFEYNYTKIV